jgi:NosR/NirI family transcriptional regulator, nitrous oxide reductase regulator
VNHRSAAATLLLAVVLTLTGSSFGWAAQPAPAAPAAEDADGWNFEDEEEAQEPTLAEAAKTQVLDIALFTGFVALSLAGFFLKSEKVKVVTLVAALVYLGFMRSQLYSVVNLFGMMTWHLPVFKYSIFTYLFWIFTLASTIIWGRLYCGRVCAFGALTQLMDKVLPRRWQLKIPPKVEARAWIFKYALLAFVVVFYVARHDAQPNINVSISRYVEPFWMFGAIANVSQFNQIQPNAMALWIGLGVLLIATVFVRNLYCRFVCPVGTFLGIISSVTTVFRIKRWAECKTCKICEKTCEWGAIQGPRIVRSECVRCDDCERLYLDQQKCPHWLIIRKKSEVLARQAAAGVPPGFAPPV